MRTTVYIAAPHGDPTPEGRARNAARARWLATVAHRMGLAPMYVHDAIELGVFGDDTDPEARAAGLASAVALAASCQVIWAAIAVGRMTDGVQREIDAWQDAHPGMSPAKGMSWPQWRAYAARWAKLARMDVPSWPG